MSETRAPYAAAPRAPLADGVYFGLPIEDYVADPALSGSAFRTLLSDPAALPWESAANPLYLKPEKSRDRARLRGSAAHCLILEGEVAYAQRYAVRPAGALVSKSDLTAWLSDTRRRWIADAVDGKLSREEREAVKQTGEREDLIARIRAIDPTVEIFDPDADGLDVLHAEDDQYVRLIERFARSDPDFARLISGGLAEITIVWSEEGRRFKARPDYLTPRAIVDLKTYGREPPRGMGLREHCVRTAAYNGYDLQAVHNARAIEVVRAWAREDRLALHFRAGESNRVRELHALCCAWERCADPPVFHWLFLRLGGAPTGIAIPFRESDGQWAEARRQIAEAIALYDQFTARFGAGDLWFASWGLQEIQDRDWPLAAVGGER